MNPEFLEAKQVTKISGAISKSTKSILCLEIQNENTDFHCLAMYLSSERQNLTLIRDKNPSPAIPRF
jgi:hypothetical protein